MPFSWDDLPEQWREVFNPTGATRRNRFGFDPYEERNSRMDLDPYLEILDTFNKDQGQGQYKGTGFRGGRFRPMKDFSRQFGNIAGGAGAGALGALANLGRGPSTADILARLEELQDPSRYLQDESALSEQAMAAASAQYDPVIAALRGQMSSATDRANRNKTALGQMFSALSTDLADDIPGIQQQYATDAKKVDQNYDQLAAQIDKQYKESGAEQEALMQRLGIEAAASETLPDQMKDRDFFVNTANVEGAAQQDALGLEKNAAVDYTRQGSQIARYEGTTRQADLMAALQDLLSEYEGQIGAQQSAKQSAYMANLGQMQQDMLGSAYDRADREAQNYLAMIQLGRQLRQDEAEMGMAGQVTATKSPADVSGRALSMGLGNDSAQKIQNVFMSTISSNPLITSGANPLTGQSLPREALAAQILESGRKAGLSDSELNALQVIALEYFGRR